MSDEQQSKRLTPDDPLSREEMAQLDLLEDAYQQVGRRMLDIELEKVQILAAGRRLRGQRMELFDNILVNRGLDPKTPCEVDPRTHRLHVLASPKEESEVPQEAPPEPESSKE